MNQIIQSHTMSTSSRPNQPQIKVVGVGFNRTGTLSLCHALEQLGLGPCYHTLHVPEDKVKWIEWANVLKGQADPEFIDSILEGFTSAMDSTVALVADSMYKAYPDAKFILTIRDVDAWEKSMKATLVEPLMKFRPALIRQLEGTATDEDNKLLAQFPWSKEQVAWGEARSTVRYNGRFPYENPRIAYLAHNKWIQEIIPPEKLLIFDVKEGWGPLVKFLGVPEPNEPFPRINDTSQYWEHVRKSH